MEEDKERKIIEALFDENIGKRRNVIDFCTIYIWQTFCPVDYSIFGYYSSEKSILFPNRNRQCPIFCVPQQRKWLNFNWLWRGNCVDVMCECVLIIPISKLMVFGENFLGDIMQKCTFFGNVQRGSIFGYKKYEYFTPRTRKISLTIDTRLVIFGIQWKGQKISLWSGSKGYHEGAKMRKRRNAHFNAEAEKLHWFTLIGQTKTLLNYMQIFKPKGWLFYMEKERPNHQLDGNVMIIMSISKIGHSCMLLVTFTRLSHLFISLMSFFSRRRRRSILEKTVILLKDDEFLGKIKRIPFRWSLCTLSLVSQLITRWREKIGEINSIPWRINPHILINFIHATIFMKFLRQYFN